MLRQKLHTATGDAADANATGAPQLGHAARQARCGVSPAATWLKDQTSFFSNSAFFAANSSSLRMPLAFKSASFSIVAITSSGLMPAAAAVGVKPEDVMATIEKLADLKAKGILTQDEFDTKKAELLKKLV